MHCREQVLDHSAAKATDTWFYCDCMRVQKSLVVGDIPSAMISPGNVCVRVIVFFSFLYSLFPPFLNCYPAFFVIFFLLYILVLSFCLLQSLLSIDLFVVAFNLYTLLVTRFCHNFIALSEINSLTLTSEKFTNTGISVHCAVADRRVSLVYVYIIYSEQ